MQPQHATRTTLAVLALAVGLCLLGACSSSSKERAGKCDQGTVCRDSDCDTICDLDEGGASMRDSDGDGTPDYLDTDSDDDGVSDRDEAGDGDPKTPPVDRNLDKKPDYLDPSYPLAHPGGGKHDAGTDTADASSTDLIDGAGKYGQDAGPISSALCPSTAIVAPLCASKENDPCDGLDDDCDGVVDGQQCGCQRGEVRACFRGPPGRRGVGACEDGMQVCSGDEFPSWGECTGGREPGAEVCDGLDNDCNGCADELDGCKAALSCPGPNDPRTPDAKPYATYTLDASKFYAGTDATSYSWSVRGGPCDRLFGAIDPNASSENGELSYQLLDSHAKVAKIAFTLSGAYEVTLEIKTKKGTLRCQWIVHVRGPGLRVELCWDKTGPVAKQDKNAVDLDLHLGLAGTTSKWLSDQDCYWDTCRGADKLWSYTATHDLDACTGPGAQNYAAYQTIGYCPNPRLDFDNRLDSASAAKYLTENANLDAPGSATFRVMVRYETNIEADRLDPNAPDLPAIETRPIVNVYCDGELAGSFGGNPELAGDQDEVLGFAHPGQMWRVADVTTRAEGGCTVTPLTAPSSGSGPTGYWLSDWDPTYGD